MKFNELVVFDAAVVVARYAVHNLDRRVVVALTVATTVMTYTR